MEFEYTADARYLLRASAQYRSSPVVETNVIATVSARAAAGDYSDFGAWIGRIDGEVVGIAVRTPPWNLLLSPMTEFTAALLAARVSVDDPQTPGVAGPQAAVTSFAAAFAAACDVEARHTSTQNAYVLPGPPDPRPAAGAPRAVDIHELDELVAWLGEFADEAGLPRHRAADRARSQIESGHVLWWEDAAGKVAVGGRSSVDDTAGGRMARIGPVYTRAAFRGRGYASAITGHLVQSIRAEGATPMLYADAANAESNHVYRRMGFTQVAAMVDYAFVPASGSAPGSVRLGP